MKDYLDTHQTNLIYMGLDLLGGILRTQSKYHTIEDKEQLEQDIRRIASLMDDIDNGNVIVERQRN